ncbi:hypothetical protein P154DRAFT_563477 [Amniculicola lignicola CBS 123094]|uniref:RING-type domain-containing protein n=1 Tax=Amniculicola lignicola CBS 123094 TaxID=1392246 RepID=A0A6A5WFF9_9PLEO|nr:hypothetical protein P154DRAFT_563477 [Amniculicola lignicola CBS 123094]
MPTPPTNSHTYQTPMSTPTNRPPNPSQPAPSPSSVPPTPLQTLVDFLLTSTTFSASPPSSPSSQPLCPICITTPDSPIQITLPTCTHIFDTDCLSRYILSGYNNCPFCRTEWYILPADLTIGVRHIDSDDDDDFIWTLLSVEDMDRSQPFADENGNLVFRERDEDSSSWTTDEDMTDRNDTGNSTDEPELEVTFQPRSHAEAQVLARATLSGPGSDDWSVRLRPRNGRNNRADQAFDIPNRTRDGRSRSPRRSQGDIVRGVQRGRSQESSARQLERRQAEWLRWVREDDERMLRERREARERARQLERESETGREAGRDREGQTEEERTRKWFNWSEDPSER